MSKPANRVKINPDVMWKRLGPQIVTLDLKTHQYHVLNDSAALIFEQCATGSAVETVASELARRFKLTRGQALTDARETIAGMVKLGLLVSTEAIKGRRVKPAARVIAKAAKERYEKPAARAITERDFRNSVASGARLVCRSLLGA